MYTFNLNLNFEVVTGINVISRGGSTIPNKVFAALRISSSSSS